MEKLVAKLAALGTPALVLLTAMKATGLHGAAALTRALKALGPGGMLGGLALLGLLGIFSECITEYGIDAIFDAVVIEMHKHGYTTEEIMTSINKQLISPSLKREIECRLRRRDDNMLLGEATL